MEKFEILKNSFVQKWFQKWIYNSKNHYYYVTLEILDNMHSDINVDMYEHFMPSLAKPVVRSYPAYNEIQ